MQQAIVRTPLLTAIIDGVAQLHCVVVEIADNRPGSRVTLRFPQAVAA